MHKWKVLFAAMQADDAELRRRHAELEAGMVRLADREAALHELSTVFDRQKRQHQVQGDNPHHNISVLPP